MDSKVCAFFFLKSRSLFKFNLYSISRSFESLILFILLFCLEISLFLLGARIVCDAGCCCFRNCGDPGWNEKGREAQIRSHYLKNSSGLWVAQSLERNRTKGFKVTGGSLQIGRAQVGLSAEHFLLAWHNRKNIALQSNAVRFEPHLPLV